MRYLSVERVTSGISVLHHDPCSSSSTYCGLLAGRCKQSGPAMTEIGMNENIKKKEEKETVVCVCGAALTDRDAAPAVASGVFQIRG